MQASNGYNFKGKQHTYTFTANQVNANNAMRTVTMSWKPTVQIYCGTEGFGLLLFNWKQSGRITIGNIVRNVLR